MAARQNRPPPQPSGGRDPAIADMSKDEKEEMLNRKMEEIKRKNEAIKKRHEEVEADKRYAQELMKSQGPVEEEGENEPSKRSPSARKEIKGQINEERKKRPLSMDVTDAKPTRLSTGRGRKLERMTKERLRAQDVVMRRSEEQQNEPGRRKERPKSEGWFDQKKIQEAGPQHERSSQHYERSNSGHQMPDRSNSRPDRGAENRFDRTNSRNEPGSGRFDRSNSRNNAGGENRYERRNDRESHGSPQDRPGNQRPREQSHNSPQDRLGNQRPREPSHNSPQDRPGNQRPREPSHNSPQDRPGNQRPREQSHNSPQDRPGNQRPHGGMHEPEQEQNPDGPPPDPTFNFLADRSRDPSKAEPRDVTRRHPGNFGGVSFGNVRKQIQHERQRVGRGGNRGGPQSKFELTMRMTGSERQRYIEWKKERDDVDEARIERQQDREGEWKREWDHDKLEQQGRKTEPARRPAGRIGSGRFVAGATHDVRQRGDMQTKGPPPNNSPPRGGGTNRGRGRGRGGHQGAPPNRARAFSSGSDDGSRSVAKEDDNLVIKIENEYAYRKKSGGQSPGDLRSPASGMPPSPGFRSEPRQTNQKVSPGDRTRPVPARGPSGRTSAPKGRGESLKARSEKQRNSGGIVGMGADLKPDDTVIVTFEDDVAPTQPIIVQKREKPQQRNVKRSNSQKEYPQKTPEQKRMPLQQRRFTPERQMRHAPPQPQEDTRHVSPQEIDERRKPEREMRHVSPRQHDTRHASSTPKRDTRHISQQPASDMRRVSPQPVREATPAEEASEGPSPVRPAAGTAWEKEEPNPDFYGVQMDEEELHSYQAYLAECREKGDKFLAEYEDDFEEIDYDQYRLKLDVDLCGVVPVSVSSPMSDMSDKSLSPFMLKTPTGHVKVIDWAAEMDNTYQDSRSSGAFESLNSTSSFAEDVQGDTSHEGNVRGQVKEEVQGGDAQLNGAQEGDVEYDEEECDEEEEGELEVGVLYDGLEGGKYYVDEDEEGADDGDDEFEDAVEDEEFYEDGEVEGKGNETEEIQQQSATENVNKEDEIADESSPAVADEGIKHEMPENDETEIADESSPAVADEGIKHDMPANKETEIAEQSSIVVPDELPEDHPEIADVGHEMPQVTVETLPTVEQVKEVPETSTKNELPDVIPEVADALPEVIPEVADAEHESPDVFSRPDQPDSYPDCDQPDMPEPPPVSDTPVKKADAQCETMPDTKELISENLEANKSNEVKEGTE